MKNFLSHVFVSGNDYSGQRIRFCSLFDSYKHVYASIFIAVHLSVLLNLQGMRDVAKEKEHMPNLEEEVREPLK